MSFLTVLGVPPEFSIEWSGLRHRGMRKKPSSWQVHRLSRRGGGFKHILFFTLANLERWSNWTNIFFQSVGSTTGYLVDGSRQTFAPTHSQNPFDLWGVRRPRMGGAGGWHGGYADRCWPNVLGISNPCARKLPTTARRMQCAPCAFRVVAGGKMGVKVGEVVLPDLLGAIQSPFVSQKSSS